MKPALVISGRDNVATALEPLEAGRPLDLGDRSVVVRETIAPGHKVALVDVAAGQPIVKYGSAIGTATVAIRAGEHVHTHNVASTRGRGDLGHAHVAPEAGVRLAEPPDDEAAAGTSEGAEQTLQRTRSES